VPCRFSLHLPLIGLGPSSKGPGTNLKPLTNKIPWIHWSLDLGPSSKVSLRVQWSWSWQYLVPESLNWTIYDFVASHLLTLKHVRRRISLYTTSNSAPQNKKKRFPLRIVRYLDEIAAMFLPPARIESSGPWLHKNQLRTTKGLFCPKIRQMNDSLQIGNWNLFLPPPSPTQTGFGRKWNKKQPIRTK
jgi:hypothetical protein